MTSRERFLTALSGGVPDRIPIMEHLFSLKLMQELLGYTTVLYDGKHRQSWLPSWVLMASGRR